VKGKKGKGRQIV